MSLPFYFPNDLLTLVVYNVFLQVLSGANRIISIRKNQRWLANLANKDTRYKELK